MWRRASLANSHRIEQNITIQIFHRSAIVNMDFSQCAECRKGFKRAERTNEETKLRWLARWLRPLSPLTCVSALVFFAPSSSAHNTHKHRAREAQRRIRSLASACVFVAWIMDADGGTAERALAWTHGQATGHSRPDARSAPVAAPMARARRQFQSSPLKAYAGSPEGHMLWQWRWRHGNGQPGWRLAVAVPWRQVEKFLSSSYKMATRPPLPILCCNCRRSRYLCHRETRPEGRRWRRKLTQHTHWPFRQVSAQTNNKLATSLLLGGHPSTSERRRHEDCLCRSRLQGASALCSLAIPSPLHSKLTTGALAKLATPRLPPPIAAVTTRFPDRGRSVGLRVAGPACVVLRWAALPPTARDTDRIEARRGGDSDALERNPSAPRRMPRRTVPIRHCFIPQSNWLWACQLALHGRRGDAHTYRGYTYCVYIVLYAPPKTYCVGLSELLGRWRIMAMRAMIALQGRTATRNS